MTTQRGLVVPLTTDQILNRARYLAQLVDASVLDSFVRSPRPKCRDIYYRLKDHNGGTDPTAPDCATDWSERDDKGVEHPRWTSDCSGADSWIHGHDRFQEKRMSPAVGYGGYWNTNSKIIDATRIIVDVKKQGAQCFVAEPRPRAGLMIICRSGAVGHAVGHEETMIEVPAEWDPNERECWEAIKTSGCRGSGAHGNGPSTGRGWFAARADTFFIRSVMTP